MNQQLLKFGYSANSCCSLCGKILNFDRTIDDEYPLAYGEYMYGTQFE